MLRRVFRLHASCEFTCLSLSAFTGDMLSPSDVAVDSPLNPSLVTIMLRRSKADPFGRGITIYVGRTAQAFCPVAAILNYLVRRGQSPGPLFLFQDGSALSKERLIASIHHILTSQGYGTAGITGHSFRIGAATARAGLDDSIIQTMGRWHSSAYMRYIHILGRTHRHTLPPFLLVIRVVCDILRGRGIMVCRCPAWAGIGCEQGLDGHCVALGECPLRFSNPTFPRCMW